MPSGSPLQCFKQTRLSSYAKIKESAWKDVTLYYYNRQKFFRLVGLACASQFIFWGWMAYFLISLKRERSQEKIFDVSSSSNPGASWKIIRFVMVSLNNNDIHLLDNWVFSLSVEFRSQNILDGQVGTLVSPSHKVLHLPFTTPSVKVICSQEI